jgi:hypothetical protein
MQRGNDVVLGQLDPRPLLHPIDHLALSTTADWCAGAPSFPREY